MSNSTNKPKTALIAGGGIAGISAAIFLDELGYEVTLIERKPILGGRTFSFTDKKTGLTIDNGQHLMIGAYHETMSLLEKLGVKHKVKMQIPTEVPIIDADNKPHEFKLGTLSPPLNLALAMLGFSGIKLKDKFGLLKLKRCIQKIQKDETYSPQDLTVLDWLKKLGQSDKALKNFWEILTLATLNDSAAVTTADGLAAVLSESYFKGRQDGFLVLPKVGLSDLFAKPAERYLVLRNQKIITGNGIGEFRFIDGKAHSFKLSNGDELKADLFVSALPFTSFLKTMPKSLVENDARLSPLKQIKPSPIISINLFYDRPFMQKPFIGSSDTKVHWFFCKDHIFPKTDSPHEQNQSSHIMGVISGAYDYLEMSKQELTAIADKEIRKLFPQSKDAKLTHSLVNKEREATLSSRIGINKIRPEQKFCDNFYIIGDWTKTGLPGTIESAVVSARKMVNQLT